MQKPQITPNTKPIAKRVKRQTTNLAKNSDQLKIYRACYENYIENELQLESTLKIRLLQVFDNFYDSKNISEIFPLKISVFHKSFLSFLSNL
jgi:hypothetical protein